jgi:hypothetical protein
VPWGSAAVIVPEMEPPRPSVNLILRCTDGGAKRRRDRALPTGPGR